MSFLIVIGCLQVSAFIVVMAACCLAGITDKEDR